MTPNAQAWLNWIMAQEIAGTTPPFSPPIPVVPPDLSSLIPGTAIADEKNGLISADPVTFSNPDLAGQRFLSLKTVGAFPVGSQASATILINSQRGSIRVTPVVKANDGNWYLAPEEGDGVTRSVPYVDKAWNLNSHEDLAAALSGFHLPTHA